MIYLFSHNIGELAPILVATFVGFPLVPISAVQILAIDLGSDVLPALALGAEPPEPDVMQRPPRSPREPLFSAAVVRRFLFLGAFQALGVCVVFFWQIHSAGIPYADFTAGNPVYREAITMTQAGIVVSQFFNAQAVRTDRESVFRVGLLSNPQLLAARMPQPRTDGRDQLPAAAAGGVQHRAADPPRLDGSRRVRCPAAHRRGGPQMATAPP